MSVTDVGTTNGSLRCATEIKFDAALEENQFSTTVVFLVFESCHVKPNECVFDCSESGFTSSVLPSESGFSPSLHQRKSAPVYNQIIY